MSDTINTVISELGAGTGQTQLMNALREVAAKTCEHGQFGKEGKVVLTLKFVPAKEGEQVIISSKVYKEVPTSTGHKKQDYNHETPFFLDKDMQLCAYVPEENPGGQLNIVDKQL